MSKFLCFAMLVTASFLTACSPGANSNYTNKPANAANATNAANTNTAANSAAVETEIKKLANDTAAALAKNDAGALENLYADTYMLVNLDGSVQNKAERLASIRSGETKFDSFAYDEIDVRSNPDGTGAVVIARATARGMNKGKKIEGTVRVTQVWSKTKDGWRQVSGHATQITSASASAPPASKPPASNTNTARTNSAATSSPAVNTANANR